MFKNFSAYDNEHICILLHNLNLEVIFRTLQNRPSFCHSSSKIKDIWHDNTVCDKLILGESFHFTSYVIVIHLDFRKSIYWFVFHLCQWARILWFISLLLKGQAAWAVLDSWLEMQNISNPTPDLRSQNLHLASLVRDTSAMRKSGNQDTLGRYI